MMAAVKIAARITPSWQRAVERAYQDRKEGRTAERVACKTYRVASASGGAAHTVVITSLVHLLATCDCAAGARGLPCRHAAAALCEAARHIAQQQAKAAPAPEPAPAPSGAEIDRRMAAAFR